MFDHLKKLKKPGTGFDVNPKEVIEKPIIKDGCFDPDHSNNWLVKEDELYLQMDLLCKNCGAMNDYNKDFCNNCNTIL